MNLYTVHYPQTAENSLTGMAQDVVLVKEGFNWSAFFLPTMWFLAKKMWIVFAIYLAVQAIVVSVVYWAELPTAVLTIIKITGNIILGFEGNNLHRWSLARARFNEHETVAARDIVAAEHRFFSSLTTGRVFNRRAGEADFAEPTP